MNPRVRPLSLAAALMALVAVTGCSALPVQPIVDAPATTSARMVDPGDEGGSPEPTLTPGGETPTPTPTADQRPGKGPKAKKPKKNNR